MNKIPIPELNLSLTKDVKSEHIEEGSFKNSGKYCRGLSAFYSAMIVLPLKNKTHLRFQKKHNFIKQKNERFILQKV
jgi:hypothetical protein